MAQKLKIKRPSRVGRKPKVSDTDILFLNNLGLSMSSMAKALDCHLVTISARLKALNVKPRDTRRSFMDDLYSKLDTAQRDWLGEQVYTGEVPIEQVLLSLLQVAAENQFTILKDGTVRFMELSDPEQDDEDEDESEEDSDEESEEDEEVLVEDEDETEED